MAPRFVEVARPLDEGTEFVTGVVSGLGVHVETIRNATDWVVNRTLNATLETIDVDGIAAWARETSSGVPLAVPRSDTLALVLSAVVALCLHFMFVLWKARSTLNRYGSLERPSYK